MSQVKFPAPGTVLGGVTIVSDKIEYAPILETMRSRPAKAKYARARVHVRCNVCGTERMMRWLYVSKGCAVSCGCKSHRTKKHDMVIYNGNEMSLHQACRETNVLAPSVRNRSRIKKMTIQQAFDYFLVTARKPRSKYNTHNAGLDAPIVLSPDGLLIK